MPLSNDQEKVFKQIMLKLGYSDTSNLFIPNFKYTTIGGLAGTGKTYLIAKIRQELYDRNTKLKVAFITYTGKASNVLRTKLIENGSFFDDDFVGTIHSLIYKPKVVYDKTTHSMIFTEWVKKHRDELDYNLIIIDEASMVSGQIWWDVLDYDIPIIAVGDYGQLPPIEGQFNLMQKPDFLLTEIKRQALDNPIIKLSLDVREGKEIPNGFFDINNKNIFILPWNSTDCKNIFNKLDFTKDEIIILCGLNKTRSSINKMIREKLNYFDLEPYPGEKIIFLKNNYDTKVVNGMLGRNLYCMYNSEYTYNMIITLEDFEESYNGTVYTGCFGKEKYDEELMKLNEIIKINKTKRKEKPIDICDFGYAMSVHKSQGSEFKKVVVFIEKSYYWDDKYMARWLYTACTRAKDKLFLISPN